MGFWGWFYAIAVGLTLFHSYVPLLPKRMRHHSFGAEIIAVSWGSSFFMRWALGDATPLIANATIDLLTAIVFLYVALRNEAAWAAVCVGLHSLMCALHLSFYLTGEVNATGYIWILNSLFLTALLVINFAILAGRHAWGEAVDQAFVSRLRGWTFSGVRDRRFQNYNKEVS